MTKEFKTFSNFITENKIAEITIEINKAVPLDWGNLSKIIVMTAESLGVTFATNEDIGKTEDDFVAYGVKGKLKAKGGIEKGSVLNPNTELNADDQKVLASIDNKLTSGITLFSELENFLEQYGKINSSIVSDILAKIKSFQEALSGELSSMS